MLSSGVVPTLPQSDPDPFFGHNVLGHRLYDQCLFCRRNSRSSGAGRLLVSKFGMNGFADTLAQELLGKGILVTTICPGGIDTPLWDLEKNPYPSDKTRIMQTEEIVDLIEYLLDQPEGTLHKKIVMFPTNEWH